MRDKPTRRWVIRFMTKHATWHQPPAGSWPEDGTIDLEEFQQNWDERFAANNISDTEAYAASKRLLGSMDRPRFQTDHLPMLIQAVKDMRAETNAPLGGGAAQNSREQALESSRRCEFCSGAGIVVVFHPRYIGQRRVTFVVADVGPGERPIVIRQVGPDGVVGTVGPGEKIVSQPGTVSAACVCDYGRWLRAHYEADRDMKGRLIDLADVREGRSRWLLEKPVAVEVPV